MGDLEKDIAAAVAQAVSAGPAGASREASHPRPVYAPAPARRVRPERGHSLPWYAGVAASSAVVLVGGGFLGKALLSDVGPVGGTRNAGRAEIRIGRVDLPDLKDGVPQISLAGGTVRSVTSAPANAVASAASPFVGAPSAPPSPASARIDALLAAPPSPEPSIRSLAGAPAAPLPVIRSTTASAPVALPVPKAAAPALPVVASATPMPPARAMPLRVSAGMDAAPAPTNVVPLPPAAPARTASLSTTPLRADAAARAKPPVVASAVRPRTGTIVADNPGDPTTTAAIGPARPVREEEHYDVLGLKVPTFGTTANRIRDGVGALGNAVTSLPERF